MGIWVVGFLTESNRRPRDWQSLALTNWATLAREVYVWAWYCHQCTIKSSLALDGNTIKSERACVEERGRVFLVKYTLLFEKHKVSPMAIRLPWKLPCQNMGRGHRTGFARLVWGRLRFTELSFIQIDLCVMCVFVCVSSFSFLDGYCSTVQGLFDWFEVDLGFTELLFIQIWFVCVLSFFF